MREIPKVSRISGRLAPLADKDWPIGLQAWRGGFATRLNIYRTMAHNPPLLVAWTGLRNHLVLASNLKREHSEVVILRCGLFWRSDYEIAHHRARARSMGFTEARLEALLGSLDCLAGDDRTLSESVDTLLGSGRLPPQLMEKLVALVGVDGTLDLVATVGMYTTLAHIANSCETPLDEDVPTSAP